MSNLRIVVGLIVIFGSIGCNNSASTEDADRWVRGEYEESYILHYPRTGGPQPMVPNGSSYVICTDGKVEVVTIEVDGSNGRVLGSDRTSVSSNLIGCGQEFRNMHVFWDVIPGILDREISAEEKVSEILRVLDNILQD